MKMFGGMGIFAELDTNGGSVRITMRAGTLRIERRNRGSKNWIDYAAASAVSHNVFDAPDWVAPLIPALIRKMIDERELRSLGSVATNLGAYAPALLSMLGETIEELEALEDQFEEGGLEADVLKRAKALHERVRHAGGKGGQA